MSAFFTRKLRFYTSFPENTPSAPIEEPFWEVQRQEALDLISNLFTHWQESWKNVNLSLRNFHLSESNLRRVNFYETEQKKEILSILSKILTAWENSEEEKFSENILALAKELRPSYPYVEYEPGEKIVLSEENLKVLREYVENEANFLKETIKELQHLSWKKIELPGEKLTETVAESLLKEKLGLTYFDFIDTESTPVFNNGYYPALLQESTDQGF